MIAENTVLAPCACGSDTWAIRPDNQLSCPKCASRQQSPVVIDYSRLRCHCTVRGGRGLWYMDRFGHLECLVCHQRVDRAIA